MNNELRLVVLLVGPLIALAMWWRIPHRRGRLMDLMALEAALVVALETAGYLTTMRGIHNTGMYNAFMVVELVWVLAIVLAQWPQAWRLVLGLALVDGLVLLGSLWLGSDDLMVHTEGILAGAVLQAAVVLVVLWHLAQHTERMLHRVPGFWLFLGLLVYFGGMAPVLAAIRWVADADNQLARRLWTIVPVLTLVRYLLAARAAQLEAGERSRGHGNG